tara:strand:+ start:208 stop:594 length:387 start_codon:yes stop_codon:yes gene_type:complete
MIEGKLPCYMIYQDDDCIVILDKYPIDNGHSLVITKKPYEKLTDMNVDEVAKLFSKIPKIASAIIKATNADAFSIAQNNGKAAKQIVPHVHVHIIPRYNLTGTLWTKRKILTENELDELAHKIKNCFE